jgi:hypothetical protein
MPDPLLARLTPLIVAALSAAARVIQPFSLCP